MYSILMSRSSLFVLILAGFALPTAPAQTVYVNRDLTADPAAPLGSRANPFVTIQSAIDYFDDAYFREHPSASTGTVRVAPGIYSEHIRLRSRVKVYGGAGGARTNIIAAGSRPNTQPVVTASGVDSRARLDGFTIRDGRHNQGAGMFIERSNLTVSGCIFQANVAEDPSTHQIGSLCDVRPQAGSGGGMMICEASPKVVDCRFEANHTQAGAGAGICMINAGPNTKIADCVFSYNRAKTCTHVRKASFAGYGGAIATWQSSPVIERCEFIGNEARQGGGVANLCESAPQFVDCRFEGNQAVITSGPPGRALGGGMLNALGCETWLTNCKFVENISTVGGGMRDGGSATLMNCVFEDNFAGVAGGALAIGFDAVEPGDMAASEVRLTNCTLWKNRAGIGGGMQHQEGSTQMVNCTLVANESTSWHMGDEEGPGAIHHAAGTLQVVNCILWANIGRDDASQIYSSHPSGLEVRHSNVEGGYVGIGNLAEDPRFRDALTGDFHLGRTSPCIDAGDVDDSILPPHDFEGDLRIMDGNGDFTSIVDMGVDERRDSSRLFLELDVSWFTQDSLFSLRLWSRN